MNVLKIRNSIFGGKKLKNLRNIKVYEKSRYKYE